MTNEMSDEKPAGASSKDRVAFLCLHLVGHLVQVQIRDGTIYEGLFDTVNLDDFSIILHYARFKQSKTHPNGFKAKAKPKEMVLIPSAEISSIFAMEVSFGGERTFQEGGFFTDSDITNRTNMGGIERELQPCVLLSEAATVTMSLESEIGRVKNTTWDQFATNERLFGVKSTWDENIYTTKLDASKITDEIRRHADRIAREIEQGDTGGNIHMMIERNMKPEVDYDEEELHSSVHRPADQKGAAASSTTGKYVPPHKRSSEPTTTSSSKKRAEPQHFNSALDFINQHGDSSGVPLPASAMSAADFEKKLQRDARHDSDEEEEDMEGNESGDEEDDQVDHRQRMAHYPFGDTGFAPEGTNSWADCVEEEEMGAHSFLPPPPPAAEVHRYHEMEGQKAKKEKDHSRDKPAAEETRRGRNSNIISAADVKAVLKDSPKPPGAAEAAKGVTHLDLEHHSNSPKVKYAQAEFTKWKEKEPKTKHSSREQEINSFKQWSSSFSLEARLSKKHEHATTGSDQHGGSLSINQPETLTKAAGVNKAQKTGTSISDVLGGAGEASSSRPPRFPATSSGRPQQLTEQALQRQRDDEDGSRPSTPNSVNSSERASTQGASATGGTLNPNAPSWTPHRFGATSTSAPAARKTSPLIPASATGEGGAARVINVAAKMVSSLLSRLQKAESQSIGGDIEYSHQWVKQPPDLMDFVYYIDLESVQDETDLRDVPPPQYHDDPVVQQQMNTMPFHQQAAPHDARATAMPTPAANPYMTANQPFAMPQQPPAPATSSIPGTPVASGTTLQPMQHQQFNPQQFGGYPPTGYAQQQMVNPVYPPQQPMPPQAAPQQMGMMNNMMRSPPQPQYAVNQGYIDPQQGFQQPQQQRPPQPNQFYQPGMPQGPMQHTAPTGMAGAQPWQAQHTGFAQYGGYRDHTQPQQQGQPMAGLPHPTHMHQHVPMGMHQAAHQQQHHYPPQQMPPPQQQQPQPHHHAMGVPPHMQAHNIGMMPQQPQQQAHMNLQSPHVHSHHAAMAQQQPKILQQPQGKKGGLPVPGGISPLNKVTASPPDSPAKVTSAHGLTRDLTGSMDDPLKGRPGMGGMPQGPGVDAMRSVAPRQGTRYAPPGQRLSDSTPPPPSPSITSSVGSSNVSMANAMNKPTGTPKSSGSIPRRDDQMRPGSMGASGFAVHTGMPSGAPPQPMQTMPPPQSHLQLSLQPNMPPPDGSNPNTPTSLTSPSNGQKIGGKPAAPHPAGKRPRKHPGS